MLNQFTLEMHYMLCSKNTLRLLHYRKSIRDALMQKSNKIMFCTNAMKMTCREQTLEILYPFGHFHCAVVNITFLSVVNFTQCFILLQSIPKYICFHLVLIFYQFQNIAAKLILINVSNALDYSKEGGTI